MVKVVGPHTIEAVPACRGAGNQLCAVAFVFGDEDESAVFNRAPNRLDELREKVPRPLVPQLVAGIQTQSVGVIFVHPMQRVFDEELAHGFAVLAIEVHACAPRCVVALGREVRAVPVDAGAIGTEVVIDDVENDGEAMGVSGVDEPSQVVWRSVIV